MLLWSCFARFYSPIWPEWFKFLRCLKYSHHPKPIDSRWLEDRIFKCTGNLSLWYFHSSPKLYNPTKLIFKNGGGGDFAVNTNGAYLPLLNLIFDLWSLIPPLQVTRRTSTRCASTPTATPSPPDPTMRRWVMIFDLSSLIFDLWPLGILTNFSPWFGEFFLWRGASHHHCLQVVDYRKRETLMLTLILALFNSIRWTIVEGC